MTRLRIHVAEREGTTGQVEIRLDGGAPVRTTLAGTSGYPVVFERDGPEGASALEVAARLTIRMADGGTEKPDLTRSFRIVDPSTSLFSSRADFDPVAAYRELLSTHGVDGRFLEDPRPEPEEVIAAAEKRLGFRLDPDHRAVLARLGPIRSDDFFMVDSFNLDRARRQIETLWGDDPYRVRQLPAHVRNLLERSTMVLVAAGDGYSALLWEGGEPGAAWRLEQASCVPERLDDEAGRPLSFREALGQELSSFVAHDLPSAEEPARILVRRGRLNVFHLAIGRRAGKLSLSLGPE